MNAEAEANNAKANEREIDAKGNEHRSRRMLLRTATGVWVTTHKVVTEIMNAKAHER